jgi:hypothetical protein
MRVFFAGVLALFLVGCTHPQPMHFYDLESGTRLTNELNDFSNEVSVTLGVARDNEGNKYRVKF